MASTGRKSIPSAAPSTTSPASATSTSARTYGQWCPIAVGMDLLGDRWVLLIVRELALGDQRFSDLKRGLPGIAPNLLSDRLQALVAHGLVTTVELPPPAARSVYRLTDAGRDVLPVLRAVARFGVRYLDDDPSDTFDARRAVHALLLPWARRADAAAVGDGPVRARLELHTGDDATDGSVVDVVLDRGDIRSEPVDPDGPDPVVTLRLALVDLLAARRGDSSRPVPVPVEVSGPDDTAAAVLGAFGLAPAERPRRPVGAKAVGPAVRKAAGSRGAPSR